MNSDIFTGSVKEFVGAARKQWGKLTEDSIEEAHGNYDEFLGLIQKNYGLARDAAEKQVQEWKKTLSKAA
jgi:uncharacterized protein YjbJ (UPF0337 family)